MARVRWSRVGYSGEERLTESNRPHRNVPTSVAPGIFWRLGVDGRPLYRVVVQASKRQLTKTGFRNLRTAEEWRDEHKGKARRGEVPRRSTISKTLREVYDELHEKRPYSPQTVANHSSSWRKIEQALGDRPITKIDGAELREVIDAAQAPAMQAKVRSLLSTIFSFAIVRQYYTAGNPVPKREAPTTRQERREAAPAAARKRYLTEKELAALLREIPERYRALIEVMARMGLRPGEAVSLQVGDFDPLRRALVIERAIGGFTKTGLARRLVLPAVVAEVLIKHLARFSTPSDPSAPMFPKADGTAIDSKNALDAWRRRHFVTASRRADVNHGLSPNHLRHSAASFAIHAGANVFDVQLMLGHAKASITLDVYGELFEGSQERLAERLDEAIRASRVPVVQEASVVRLR